MKGPKYPSQYVSYFGGVDTIENMLEPCSRGLSLDWCPQLGTTIWLFKNITNTWDLGNSTTSTFQSTSNIPLHLLPRPSPATHPQHRKYKPQVRPPYHTKKTNKTPITPLHRTTIPHNRHTSQETRARANTHPYKSPSSPPSPPPFLPSLHITTILNIPLQRPNLPNVSIANFSTGSRSN